MKKIFSLIIVCAAVGNFSMHAQDTTGNMKNNFTLVIHGGAGTIKKEQMSKEKEEAYQDMLNKALKVGYDILAEGGSSLDAVEAAIRLLEDAPLFNAGKGAVFTSEGTNEMDASIMEGKTLKAGAVAGVKTIKNPISGARAVMEHSPHVMLSGEGAETFAREQGLDMVDPEYFKDEKRYEQWKKIKETNQQKLDHDSENESGGERGEAMPGEPDDYKYGTVGAVALDRFGNLAAATSTGGMTNKRYGRIGDSPVIAAGTYAENGVCAVSCTGHGEYFIRAVVAYDIVARMKYKKSSLEQAANEVIHEKLIQMNGSGGLIAVDAQGNVAMPFNTHGMFRGFINQDAVPMVKMYKD